MLDRGDPTGPHSSQHRDHQPSPGHDERNRSAYADPSGALSAGPDRDQTPPLLRVVRGEPSAEELAALTVVVAALSSQSGDRRRPTPVGAWASFGGRHRRALRHGVGGWPAAGQPS